MIPGGSMGGRRYRYRRSSVDRDIGHDDWRLRRDLHAEGQLMRRDLQVEGQRLRREVDRARRNGGSPHGAGSGGVLGAFSGMRPEEVAGRAVLPFVVIAALVLLTGHLSALVFNGGAPSYRASEIPGVLGRLVTHPGDPAAAWAPVNTGTAVPDTFAWWLVFLALVVLITLAVLLPLARSGRERGRRRPRRGENQPVTPKDEWGGLADQHRLRVRHGEENALVVGTANQRRLAVRDHHSLLVVGPAMSGKTSSLVVPALLEWQGPAIVAASKGHLIDETIGWRSQMGEVHVFDPAAITPYRRSSWSMLATCTSWHGAIHTAHDLTVAATAAAGATPDGDDLTGHGRGDLWRSAAAMIVAPFLYAAASSGKPITQVATWMEREDLDEVYEILALVDRSAADIHRANIEHANDRRHQFLRVIARILGVYRDPLVRRSSTPHELEPADLLDGTSGTLYLTAPETDQARFRPLNAMVRRQVLNAAYELSTRRRRPLDPPLLVILDQVVGVAPVDDLATMASTTASRGVQLVSVFQDFDQIEDHYGHSAEAVVKNHRARLVLPDGQQDDVTNEGATLVPRRLSGQLAEGEGALLYGNTPPIRLKLRPWYKDRDLRARVETTLDAVAPAKDELPPNPFEPIEQTNAWLRRRGDRSGRTAHEDPRSAEQIPLDESFTEVFGSTGAETPDNVTPLSDRRGRDRRR